MTLKLIMLLAITVCAAIALCAGFFVDRKEKKQAKKNNKYKGHQTFYKFYY